MFVQVIQGRVSDPDALRARLDEWVRDLAPSADGWLGSTGGCADDGTAIALARFESEQAARRNSDRPEQGAWWGEVAPLFSGDPVFHDSADVDVELVGDPGAAGFVQIIQGRSSDPARARALMSRDPEVRAALRPDVLGSLTANYEAGGFTTAIYFTSEQAAREAERKEMPPEMQAAMQELMGLSIGQPTFIDLKDPWLHAPG